MYLGRMFFEGGDWNSLVISYLSVFYNSMHSFIFTKGFPIYVVWDPLEENNFVQENRRFKMKNVMWKRTRNMRENQ